MNYLFLILLIISGLNISPLFSSLNGDIQSYVKSLPQEKGKNTNSFLEKELFQKLLDQKMVRQKGPDAEMRPVFVGLQATVERMITEMLARGTCEKSFGIILTPAPPTPLCSKGEISKELVHPSMLNDEKSLQTVKERPSILRSYLEVGGVICAAFPEEGYALRTEGQLAIFKGLSAAYPKQLLSCLLKTKAVPEEKIGATYFFKEAGSDEWMVFSIHSTQAISPKDDTHWGVWLGSVKDPEILKKAQEVITYVKEMSSPEVFPVEISSILEGTK